MKANILILMVGLLMNYVVGVAFIYLFVLIVRALKKYIKSEPVRKDSATNSSSFYVAYDIF